MARILFSVAAPAISAATQVTAPVSVAATSPNQPLASQVSSPAANSGVIQLASAIGYTPNHDMTFENFKTILTTKFQAKVNTAHGSDVGMLNLIWEIILPAIDEPTNALEFQNLLKAAPFSSIDDIYGQSVDNALADLTSEMNGWTASSQIKVDEVADKFVKNLVNKFNTWLPYDKDFYKVAVDDAGLNAFVQSLVQAKVPFKGGQTDYPTIINDVANKILNEAADAVGGTSIEVKVFQDKINSMYATADAFKTAIVKKIVQEYIDYNNIATKMEEDVEKDLKINQDKIDTFGLAKLSADFNHFYEANVKIKFEGGQNSEVQSKARELRTKLDAETNKAVGDVKAVVDDWAVNSRDAFVKGANNLLDVHLSQEITRVQTAWNTILGELPTKSSYWDAYSIAKQFNDSSKTATDSFKALWELLGKNTTNITKFLKDFSSDTLVYDPKNFDSVDAKALVPKTFKATQVSVDFKQSEPEGQKTIFGYTFQLSNAITENEKTPNKFIPNYETDTAVKTVYDFHHENYVSVNELDLKNIILNDFKNKSDPNNENNPWKVASPYSSLDLDTYFKGVDTHGNHLLSDFLTTPILMLDTTEDVGKLFPRINELITSSDFSETLQDTLFGVNVQNKANIFIDKNNRPVASVINPAMQISKLQNYDLILSIQVGANTIQLNKTDEIIQANNVEVYNADIDNKMVNAFSTYLSKIFDQFTQEDKSYVSFIVGEFWKWQNITDPVDKKPMTVQFTELYQLINLLFSNKGQKSQTDNTPVSITKVVADPTQFPDQAAVDEELDRLKNLQLNELSSFYYPNNAIQTPLRNLLNSYSTNALLNSLRTTGSIELTQDINGTWKVNVTFKSQSSRFKDQTDPTYPTAPEPTGSMMGSFTTAKFEMSIHLLTTEIEKAIKEVNEKIDPYKPLFDAMVGKGDIDQSSLNTFLETDIKNLVDKFKIEVAQKEVQTDIDNLKGLTLNRIEEAAVKWIAQNSKNASGQLKELQTQLDQATTALTQDANFLQAMSQPDGKTDIEAYKTEMAKAAIAQLTGKQLTEAEQQEIAAAKAKIAQYQIPENLLNKVMEYETKIRAISEFKLFDKYKGVISTATDWAVQAAKKNNNDPYNPMNIAEDSELAINYIAEYLALADLSDISSFEQLREFIKNPGLAQHVVLDTPMKAAIIGLGSVMGLVGVATTGATLTSIRTNRQLRKIGESASIEYEKPWKIMIIKGLISFATLAAAAAIITLVFTLGGGI